MVGPKTMNAVNVAVQSVERRVRVMQFSVKLDGASANTCGAILAISSWWSKEYAHRDPEGFGVRGVTLQTEVTYPPSAHSGPMVNRRVMRRWIAMPNGSRNRRLVKP